MAGIIILVILLVLIFIILFCYLYLRNKFRGFLLEYFGTNSFKDALNKTKIEAESTPKSLSGMDSIYLSKIKKDFPSLNINELKSKTESIILDIFQSVEDKDKDAYKEYDKINSYIRDKINNYKKDDVHFHSKKIHKTVINKYENKDGVSTIYFQSSMEYIKKVNTEEEKIQTRFTTEFIYIVDENKVEERKKALGLNCPNCGAPIKGVGNRVCVYCGSGIEDIVKRAWTINNIAEF